MIRRLVISLVAIVVLAIGLFVGNTVAHNKPSLGLDLQGGASVTMTPVGDFDEAALTVAVDIIRQRVDSIGVAEPEIIRQGKTRRGSVGPVPAAGFFAQGEFGPIGRRNCLHGFTASIALFEQG